MTEQPSRPYATPAALRQALTHRLAAAAAEGPWPLADLQRQFAYDRLLHRLYLLDSGWILKGATALLARQISARHTIDLDIYRAATRAEAERDLRTAAAIDAGDWFEFEIGAGRPLAAEGAAGTRLPATARIGNTVWASFHIDLVGEAIGMTGTPDNVPPLTPVTLPGLERPGYRAYPIVDHIADKICAIFTRHGTEGRPSTRYKDLLDLVSFATTTSVAADEQRRALRAEAERRDLTLPHRFDVPDRELWEAGYRAEAGRATTPAAASLEQALAIVRPLVDPLLEHTATGMWDPAQRAWRS
ncbi:MAG: nucleotidyl transferase AbiEii/AbiGii toxin family protein [Actinobacteria bacterium]|nr:nucleotidyl transferase AbiEii/AbiGii toxin family protein [Actinomycetota bacterium]